MKRSPRHLAAALSLLTLWPRIGRAEALPVLEPGGPDAAAYGQAQGYPGAGWHGAVNRQAAMVGSYSHYDTAYPGRAIAASATPGPIRRAQAELSLTYTHGGAAHTLADYVARTPATGLLVARGGTILYEHYQYGRGPADRMLSQSMAKTVTAMLVGIAVEDGAIHSIDDLVEVYLPALKGSAIGGTPLRALLHMASGVEFLETYDGHDDAASLGRALLDPAGPPATTALRQFDTRVAPPDTRFHYAGRDTEALGLVLAKATGQTLSALLEQRIWQPMGAEAPATWSVDHDGAEIAYCCLSATVRDWARLGLLLADGGAVGGRQVLPRRWVEEMTRYEPGSFLAPSRDGLRWGYGYQTWLMSGARHDVALMGIHGQRVFIDPASRLVLVQTAVHVPATGNPGDLELVSLWRALVAQEATR